MTNGKTLLSHHQSQHIHVHVHVLSMRFLPVLIKQDYMTQLDIAKIKVISIYVAIELSYFAIFHSQQVALLRLTTNKQKIFKDMTRLSLTNNNFLLLEKLKNNCFYLVQTAQAKALLLS